MSFTEKHGKNLNLLTLDDSDARLVAEVSLVLPREIDLAKDTVIGRDK
jgi:hypothetical protein